MAKFTAKDGIFGKTKSEAKPSAKAPAKVSRHSNIVNTRSHGEKMRHC
jgi:hypothetical protein